MESPRSRRVKLPLEKRTEHQNEDKKSCAQSPGTTSWETSARQGMSVVLRCESALLRGCDYSHIL